MLKGSRVLFPLLTGFSLCLAATPLVLGMCDVMRGVKKWILGLSGDNATNSKASNFLLRLCGVSPTNFVALKNYVLR